MVAEAIIYTILNGIGFNIVIPGMYIVLKCLGIL